MNSFRNINSVTIGMKQWQNFQALCKVKNGIEQQVGEVATILENSLDKEQVGQLTPQEQSLCIANLGRTAGVLWMMECHELALLADEILGLLEDAANIDIEQDRQQIIEMRQLAFVALEDLPALVDGVLSGQIRHWHGYSPIFNRIRKARNRSLVFSSKTLLTKKAVNFRKAFLARPEHLKTLLDQQLKRYNDIKKRLHSNGSVLESVRKLHTVFFELEVMSRDFRLATLWGLCAAIAEALPEDQANLENPTIKLLGSFSTILQMVSDKGIKALHQNIPDEILKKILAALALQPAATERLCAIKSWFELDLQLAAIWHKDNQELLVSYHRKDAFAKAIRLIIERTGQLSDTINDAIAADHGTRQQLETFTGELRAIQHSITTLGMPSLVEFLAACNPSLSLVAGADAAVPLAETAITEYLERCAQALYRCELALLRRAEELERAVFVSQAGKHGGTALTGVKLNVVLEAIKNLEQVVVAINNCAEVDWDISKLTGVAGLLHGAGAALSAVPLATAAGLCAAAQNFVATKLGSGVLTVADPSFENETNAFAHLIISGILYLEQVSIGRLENCQRIEHECNAYLEILGASPLVSTAIADRSVNATFGLVVDPGVISVSIGDVRGNAAVTLTLDGGAAVSVSTVDTSAAETADSVTSATVVSVVDRSVDEAVEHAADTSAASPTDEQAATATHDGSGSTSIKAVSTTDEDDEIHAIFVAEAGELLEQINDCLVALTHRQDDAEALADLRRSYHTLKGSGRMVGAEAVGALAWSVENLLNNVMSGRLQIGTPMLDGLKQVPARLLTLVSDFEGKLPTALDAGSVAADIARIEVFLAHDKPGHVETKAASVAAVANETAAEPMLVAASGAVTETASELAPAPTADAGVTTAAVEGAWQNSAPQASEQPAEEQATRDSPQYIGHAIAPHVEPQIEHKDARQLAQPAAEHETVPQSEEQIAHEMQLPVAYEVEQELEPRLEQQAEQLLEPATEHPLQAELEQRPEQYVEYATPAVSEQMPAMATKQIDEVIDEPAIPAVHEVATDAGLTAAIGDTVVVEATDRSHDIETPAIALEHSRADKSAELEAELLPEVTSEQPTAIPLAGTELPELVALADEVMEPVAAVAEAQSHNVVPDDFAQTELVVTADAAIEPVAVFAEAELHNVVPDDFAQTELVVAADAAIEPVAVFAEAELHDVVPDGSAQTEPVVTADEAVEPNAAVSAGHLHAVVVDDFGQPQLIVTTDHASQPVAASLGADSHYVETYEVQPQMLSHESAAPAIEHGAALATTNEVEPLINEESVVALPDHAEPAGSQYVVSWLVEEVEISPPAADQDAAVVETTTAAPHIFSMATIFDVSSIAHGIDALLVYAMPVASQPLAVTVTDVVSETIGESLNDSSLGGTATADSAPIVEELANVAVATVDLQKWHTAEIQALPQKLLPYVSTAIGTEPELAPDVVQLADQMSLGKSPYQTALTGLQKIAAAVDATSTVVVTAEEHGWHSAVQDAVQQQLPADEFVALEITHELPLLMAQPIAQQFDQQGLATLSQQTEMEGELSAPVEDVAEAIVATDVQSPHGIEAQDLQQHSSLSAMTPETGHEVSSHTEHHEYQLPGSAPAIADVANDAVGEPVLDALLSGVEVQNATAAVEVPTEAMVVAADADTQSRYNHALHEFLPEESGADHTVAPEARHEVALDVPGAEQARPEVEAVEQVMPSAAGYSNESAREPLLDITFASVVETDFAVAVKNAESPAPAIAHMQNWHAVETLETLPREFVADAAHALETRQAAALDAAERIAREIARELKPEATQKVVREAGQVAAGEIVQEVIREIVQDLPQKLEQESPVALAEENISVGLDVIAAIDEAAAEPVRSDSADDIAVQKAAATVESDAEAVVAIGHAHAEIQDAVAEEFFTDAVSSLENYQQVTADDAGQAAQEEIGQPVTSESAQAAERDITQEIAHELSQEITQEIIRDAEQQVPAALAAQAEMIAAEVCDSPNPVVEVEPEIAEAATQQPAREAELQAQADHTDQAESSITEVCIDLIPAAEAKREDAQEITGEATQEAAQGITQEVIREATQETTQETEQQLLPAQEEPIVAEVAVDRDLLAATNPAAADHNHTTNETSPEPEPADTTDNLAETLRAEFRLKINRIRQYLDGSVSVDADGQAITSTSYLIPVHTLYGTGRVAGLTQLGTAAGRLEKLLQDHPYKSVDPGLNALLAGFCAIIENAIENSAFDSGFVPPAGLQQELDTFLLALDSVRNEMSGTSTIDADAAYAIASTHSDATAVKVSDQDALVLEGFLGETRATNAHIQQLYASFRKDNVHDRNLARRLREQFVLFEGAASVAQQDAIAPVCRELASAYQQYADGLYAVNETVIILLDMCHGHINACMKSLDSGIPVETQAGDLHTELKLAIAQMISLRNETNIQVAEEKVEDSLLAVFIEEAGEILQELDSKIADWQQAPDDKDILDDLLRSLHTLKGSAALVGEKDLSESAHRFETCIIESGRTRRNRDKHFFAEVDRHLNVLQVLFALYHTDANGRLVKTPIGEEELKRLMRVDVAQFIEDKLAAAARIMSVMGLEPLKYEAPSQPAPQAPVESTPVSAASTAVADKKANPVRKGLVPDANAQPGLVVDEHVRVSANLLKSLLNDADEISIARNRVEQTMADMQILMGDMEETLSRIESSMNSFEFHAKTRAGIRQAETSVGKPQGETADSAAAKGFDALEMDKYTELQQIVLSLLEDYNDVMDIKNNVSGKIRSMSSILMDQQRSTNKLQEGLVSSQMVPFAGIAPRLRRLVRQVSTDLDKQVTINFGNPEGKIDRSVLQALINPIEHMIRNAVDHGIESTQERMASGKQGQGELLVKLYRQGANIILDIADDGRGINTAKVRQKAIAQGLIAETDVVTEQELCQFILRAGFSTADTVSHISGRGVGLDVVQDEITQIGGDIEILSTPGMGTTFRIRLPLTSSLNRALLFSVAGADYVMLLNTIDGIILEKNETLQRSYRDDKSAFFQYGDKSYELAYLGSMLGDHAVPEFQGGKDASSSLVLVSGAGKNLALHVDAVVGSRELVVKALGAQFASIPVLTGGVILGDGRVVVVLDPRFLVDNHVARKVIPASPEPAQPSEVVEAEFESGKTIMVVDDSITVRKVTSAILKRNGMNVILAKNGIEACELLHTTRPDIMLLDIEMPKMDGFEVAAYVRRQESGIKDLPIIMITSRIGEKHRTRAEEIGVNQYMCKPFQEVNLLEAIAGYN